jgi:hypothetical protein
MDIGEATVAFQVMKAGLVDATGLAKDALHIYFGLALFLVIRLVWPWRGGWLVAWTGTLVMTLGGEWLDLRGENLRGVLQPDSAHWHDIWNTMFWPTVLALIGRWLHRLPTPATAPLPLSDERAERGGE